MLNRIATTPPRARHPLGLYGRPRDPRDSTTPAPRDAGWDAAQLAGGPTRRTANPSGPADRPVRVDRPTDVRAAPAPIRVLTSTAPASCMLGPAGVVRP